MPPVNGGGSPPHTHHDDDASQSLVSAVLPSEQAPSQASSAEMPTINSRMARIAAKVKAYSGSQGNSAARYFQSAVAIAGATDATGPESSEDLIAHNIVRLANRIARFKPNDPAEEMLVASMIAIQMNGMNCLANANNASSLPVRQSFMAMGMKMSSLFLQQMQALDKHRGNGQQQNVVVRHVHVENGGQAVVGHVTSGKDGAKAKTDTGRTANGGRGARAVRTGPERE